MAVQIKIQKSLTALNEDKDCKDHIDTTASTINNNLNAPKHGTVIPNRVFVGGIAPATTELDLIHLFSSYGNVTGTKIISDRAGVSKGYGFVTFETEDEAKRLQKDAENIVLGQRRLNIAPAIKKQGFGRGSYDCTAGSPIPPTQVYRHNGITYAFHNGMAFFPQPSPQVPPSSHVEPSPVYQSGTSYGAVTPSSPGPAYPFSYAPQGQIFYQAPQYQYHVPQQYDGCYEGGQVMVADGSLVIPQYYLAPQPAPELAYYQPATVHPQETSAPSVQQLIYASPRAYESALVYSTEQKCGMDNGMNHHNGPNMMVNKEEGDPSITNNHRRTRESTPVVSLLKLYKGKDDQPRRKHHQQDDGRRQQHLNNNNPDTTNRNLKHQEARRGTPPTIPYQSAHATPNPRHPPVQVPQFPYYPRQVLAPPTALASFYPPPPPQARPRPYYRSRYGGGRGGGRGGGSSKWLAKEEELGQPLTPPITPRSEPAGVPGTTAGPEDVVQSIQALAI